MKKLISILACLLSAHNVSAFAAMTTPTNTKTFSLHTNAFRNLGPIPKLYSCDDQDISPDLTWQNIPAKTKSLALILSDPDAPSGTFYHWVLYNIPPTLTNLPEGIHQLPEGVMVGKNSWGKQQYNGPCPPKNAEHRYVFTLYALDIMLPLNAGADVSALMSAMRNHVVNKAILTGLFKH